VPAFNGNRLALSHTNLVGFPFPLRQTGHEVNYKEAISMRINMRSILLCIFALSFVMLGACSEDMTRPEESAFSSVPEAEQLNVVNGDGVTRYDGVIGGEDICAFFVPDDRNGELVLCARGRRGHGHRHGHGHDDDDGDGGPVEFPAQPYDIFFVDGIVSEVWIVAAPEWLENDDVSLDIEIYGINDGFHEHGTQLGQLVSGTTHLATDQGESLVSVDWHTDVNITHSPESYTVCVQAMYNGLPFGVVNCSTFGPF
jgi:hypothetical protein